MTSILEVLSASGKTTIQDDILGNHEVLFLTLTDRCGNSDNRYYVCLEGEKAQIDWQAGDRIMVELSLCAYKHGNQWHMAKLSDSIQLVEIGIVSNNNNKG